MIEAAYDRMNEEEADSPERTWAPVKNLDEFCSNVYMYYIENGFWCIVLKRITKLINLAFTICFSTFLLLFVDWSAVVECHQSSCDRLIRANALSNLNFGGVIVVLYFIIFSVYWLWNAVDSLFVLSQSWQMSTFYSQRLEIQDEEIPMLQWHEVLERLVKVQKKVQLCVVKDFRDSLDITNRIMRKENYMIAMVNTGVFKIETFIFGQHSGVFGSTLEWNLRVCILNAMFDEKFSVKDFLDSNSGYSYSENLNLNDGIAKLKRRFITMGIINLIFMPFIAIFLVIHFVLRHFEEFHSKRSSLGPREWTLYAKWHLQEYNELPHFFERRLRASLAPAQNYVNQFPMNLSTIVAQCVAYVSGAVVGALLILSLTGSRSVLNVYVGDRSLIWYLAVFTAILAVSRSMIPESIDIFNPHEAMAEVVKHTHYCPVEWRKRFHEVSVRNAFGDMFKPTLQVFLGEILCVITTPLILCCYLPSRAEAILRCIEQLTVELDGVGDVCGPAVFDLAKFSRLRYAQHQQHEEDEDAQVGRQQQQQQLRHGDNKRTGSNIKSSTTELQNSRIIRKYAEAKMPFADRAELEEQYLEPFKSNQGKLEKSLVSFLCNHPYYQTDQTGATLLTALNSQPTKNRFVSLQKQQQQQQQQQRETVVDMKRSNNPRRHPKQESDDQAAASQLSLSQYMRGSIKSSQMEESKTLSDSDIMLRCSFSQILREGGNANLAKNKEAAEEKTKLFAALESVYEDDEIDIEMESR
mmetsp:Transcript_12725/g.20372  ORF Transcript_12725/g.20372 Transcript_12725/m.20372 type:complete len:751 (-) Transcript_12725:191-2443(-)